MYCSVCGTHIDSDSATFCPNCGANLTKETPTDSLPPPSKGKKVSLDKEPSHKKARPTYKWIYAVVSCLALLAVVLGGILMYHYYSTTKEIDAFSGVVSSYREFRDEYPPGSYADQYDSLLDKCNLCISEKDTDLIATLSDQIKELKSNIKQENKELEEYRAELTTLKNATSLYDMKGNDKNSYTSLISKFETAIDKNDLSGCKAVSKQLLEFTSKLDKTAGQTSSANYEEELKRLKEALSKEPASSETNIYISPDNKPNEEDTGDAGDAYVDVDYLLPYSGTSYISSSELAGFSKWELTLARNEIYARHGRKFKDDSIQAYFNSKAWYHGTISPSNFDEDTYFNKYEKKNVSTIKHYEENH